MRISMKEIWRNLDGPPKNKELWSYIVKFEFSRPEVAQWYPPPGLALNQLEQFLPFTF